MIIYFLSLKIFASSALRNITVLFNRSLKAGEFLLFANLFVSRLEHLGCPVRFGELCLLLGFSNNNMKWNIEKIKNIKLSVRSNFLSFFAICQFWEDPKSKEKCDYIVLNTKIPENHNKTKYCEFYCNLIFIFSF